MDDGEKRRIGVEIKNFLAINGIDRGHFAEQSRLGKSTIDKLVTGIFSEKTLIKVVENTKFRLKTNYAAKILGSYSKLNWSGYMKKFLMIHSALDDSGSIECNIVNVDWDDTIPGLVMRRDGDFIGALWIPHERSPLIYVQPTDQIGVRLILSTMVGEPLMRGLFLRVENIVANAYVPVALPVVFKRIEDGERVPSSAVGIIDVSNEWHLPYSRHLRAVIDRKFGRLIIPRIGSNTIKRT